ncbi:hypothetical protein PG997_009203 [Apiospora hydei]|uniref:Uncharacterized protein n=1 Tax=Apiospora hydei TaxID=1337664 RepID=A0ABR1VWK0_9PEZI
MERQNRYRGYPSALGLHEWACQKTDDNVPDEETNASGLAEEKGASQQPRIGQGWRLLSLPPDHTAKTESAERCDSI